MGALAQCEAETQDWDACEVEERGLFSGDSNFHSDKAVELG